ncbi:hypothetical protein QBC32DRAFT_125590 [Pseudoneurospora amorphoporcata]|uniref:Zn(2)-C6 fungal-type domain-containing protein n=1 Tax=Pseudoneurospora amorphoporcata TaxID=241081 RepID=A0AAN6SHF2_9PEZI|nr:hypothetical protein QBC32DRAFT_125590 [Pseudoneurospora amorphoporcata]
MVSNSEGAKEKEPVKRRACDECRARKLACSKEPDGCARCKREGVHCNYSAQKPMGRPRKRPHIDVAEASRKEAKTDDVFPSETSVALTYPVNMPFDGTLNLDLDMCFLDVTNTDINFVDILDPNFQFGSYGFPFSLDYDIPLPGPTPGQIEAMPKEDTRHVDHAWMDSSAAVNAHWQPALGEYLTGNVNFDNLDVQASTSSFSSIQQYSSPFPKREQPEGIYAYPDYASYHPDTFHNHHGSRPASLSEVSDSTVPHLTPGGSSSTSPCDSTNTNDHTSSQPAGQCACGDNLREAMESLRYVPTDDITQALYTVRTVTKIAHETILCTICGDPPSTPFSADSKTEPANHADETEPPVSAIQNMVLLAAILPSLSSSYTLLLDLVEKETHSATVAGRNIFFDLEGYGGLWGTIATSWKRCEDMVALLAQPLPSITWRLMARAMLKLDVYGQGGAPRTAGQGTVIRLGGRDGKSNGLEGPCDTVVHIGLKDIFARMEERSRRRQERLEALVASGELELEGVLPSVPLGGFVIGSGSESSASPTTPTRISSSTSPKAKNGGKKSQGMRIIDSAKSAMDKLLIP